MITVVIPVYNRAKLVERTLASLDAQTRRPEAVVLVDNNSSDGSLTTLRRWAADKPWVTVISETKPGAACARNAGLALVNTPYVMFFDSDDVMPRRHIEQVADGLTRAGLPQVGAFNMDLIDTEGHRHHKPFRRGDALAVHLFHSTLSTQRCIVSTGLARRIGGWDETLGGWDDMEFGTRLLARRPTLAYIPIDEPVEAYAQAESITGTDFSSKAGQWERALDACEKAVSGTEYERLVNYRRAILAGMYRREKRPDLARGLSRGAWMRLIEWYVSLGGRGVALLAGVWG